MNPRFLILVVLLATFSSSCKKIDELTHFKMVFDEPIRDVKILPVFVGETIPIEMTTATYSESEFHKNDTAKDLVEGIILEKASLTIEEAFSTNFSFLESIKFYMQAEGEEDLLIAFKTNIPSDIGKTLNLEVIDQDLSSFLKEEELELKVEILAREAVLDPFDLIMHLEFEVDAKVAGV